MASDELKPCDECGAAVGYVSGERFHAEHERLRELRKDFDTMRQRVELLEGLLATARDYVYAELEDRKQALAGYPHKWQQEEADLAEIDAALATKP